jgi:hypothetical protein
MHVLLYRKGTPGEHNQIDRSRQLLIRNKKKLQISGKNCELLPKVREMTMDFSFLGEGTYKAELLKDGKFTSILSTLAQNSYIINTQLFKSHAR